MSPDLITNIPTEVLRTLIAVADLRSFTKAANLLGVTQPAVSAQLKRLQQLLDTELFDKSVPGVALTEKGEVVVNYARRMLAINDQILNMLAPHPALPAVRVSIPGDFGSSVLPNIIARFQARAPHLRIQLRGDTSENALRDLRQGQLELAVALTMSGPALDARHFWPEESVWIRGPSAALQLGGRVPVVTLRDGTFLHRLTTMALTQAEREYEIVFVASSLASLQAAVAAGLGVALLSRRDVIPGVETCEEGLLPSAPDAYCGIYLREGSHDAMLAELTDAIADALTAPLERAKASHRAIEASATDSSHTGEPRDGAS